MGILDTIIVALFIDGVNTGVLVPGIVGLIMVFIFLNREYRWFDLTIRSRWIKGILKLAMISLIVSFVIIESIILFSVKSEANAEVDYLMILGAGLRGEEISLALQERMEKGVVYLINNPDAAVIVSGGQGT
ncbi:MAG: hypothetical protein K0R31_1509, partial [Clostridiales bacterium]|nr:hypothetical protein [Clostridiales bacterium]